MSPRFQDRVRTTSRRSRRSFASPGTGRTGRFLACEEQLPLGHVHVSEPEQAEPEMETNGRRLGEAATERAESRGAPARPCSSDRRRRRSGPRDRAEPVAPPRRTCAPQTPDGRAVAAPRRRGSSRRHRRAPPAGEASASCAGGSRRSSAGGDSSSGTNVGRPGALAGVKQIVRAHLKTESARPASPRATSPAASASRPAQKYASPRCRRTAPLRGSSAESCSSHRAARPAGEREADPGLQGAVALKDATASARRPCARA